MRALRSVGLLVLLAVLATSCGRAASVKSDPTAAPTLVAASLTPRPSPSHTAEPTATPSASPSATPSASATVTPTITPSPSQTAGPPPQVLRSYPLDGDLAVQSDLPLMLVFDRAMDPASAGASLAFSPTVTGQLSWPSADRLVFQPDAPWSSGQHELRLAEARSAEGVALAEPLVLRFGVGGRGVPIPVLMYHHLRDLPEDASAGQRSYSVSPDAFGQQMDYLVEHGWRTISASELAGYFAGEPLPPHACMVTMDDGYKEVDTVARPVFARTGLRPVLFPIVTFMDYGAYLTWDQLATLVAEGYSVGDHSYDHTNLRDLGPADLLHQIVDSKAVLEDRLGITIDAFSYPYGSYNAAIIATLAEQGYRTAYTINPTIYQVPFQPYHISRLNISYDMTLDEFAALLP